MNDRIEKRDLMTRLRRVGLWDVADSHRGLVRLRRREAGEDRKTATQGAWREIWALYEPVVERLEVENDTGSEETRLAGIPADLDSVLDPNYSERDRGKQLRDGLLWAALEWARVIRDTADGPVANVSAATTPPPNSWAISVLNAYALGGIDKRRELITRAMAFASKTPDEPEPVEAQQPGGFLADIGGQID